jgi:hypothetical protein
MLGASFLNGMPFHAVPLLFLRSSSVLAYSGLLQTMVGLKGVTQKHWQHILPSCKNTVSLWLA